MASLNLSEHPHRRLNPLTREWVLVSPHRTQRPWLGQIEKLSTETPPAYDPGCYMCPGNTRAVGISNPEYSPIFMLDNDYAAVLLDTPATSLNETSLLAAQRESGACRVAAFCQPPDSTLPRMVLTEFSLRDDVEHASA